MGLIKMVNFEKYHKSLIYKKLVVVFYKKIDIIWYYI